MWMPPERPAPNPWVVAGRRGGKLQLCLAAIARPSEEPPIPKATVLDLPDRIPPITLPADLWAQYEHDVARQWAALPPATLCPLKEPPMPSLVTRLAPNGPTTESYTEWLQRQSRWQRRALQALVVGGLLLLLGLLATGCSRAERTMYQLEGPWACVLHSGLPVEAAELAITNEGKWGLITTGGHKMRGWGPITCQELGGRE